MYKIRVDGKAKHLLWAEAIRDIGILFLVFAPLDTLVMWEGRHWWEWLIALGVAITGVLLLRKGVKMESE
jgi:hypothetical protein